MQQRPTVQIRRCSDSKGIIDWFTERHGPIEEEGRREPSTPTCGRERKWPTCTFSHRFLRFLGRHGQSSIEGKFHHCCDSSVVRSVRLQGHSSRRASHPRPPKPPLCRRGPFHQRSQSGLCQNSCAEFRAFHLMLCRLRSRVC